MTNQDPGGWHPAPDRPGYQRYWDGTQWTEHYAPLQADATQQAPVPDATAAYAAPPPGVGGPAAPYGGPPPGGPDATPSKGGAAKILIPVAACVVLAIVAVVVGVILTSGDDDSADPTTTTTEEADPSTTDGATTTDEATTTEQATTTDEATTTTTTAGSGTASGTFEAGRYTFSDVQVSQDFVDDFEVRARMTNNGADVGSVSLTVTILSGGSVVGTGTGFASNVASGATVTVEFISVDDFVAWDSVEFQVDAEF